MGSFRHGTGGDWLWGEDGVVGYLNAEEFFSFFFDGVFTVGIADERVW